VTPTSGGAKQTWKVEKKGKGINVYADGEAGFTANTTYKFKLKFTSTEGKRTKYRCVSYTLTRDGDKKIDDALPGGKGETTDDEDVGVPVHFCCAVNNNDPMAAPLDARSDIPCSVNSEDYEGYEYSLLSSTSLDPSFSRDSGFGILNETRPVPTAWAIVFENATGHGVPSLAPR